MRRRPATKTFQSTYVLDTPCDLSDASLKDAVKLSMKLSGLTPDILLVGPTDNFPAREIILANPGFSLDYWIRHDFKDGEWYVGTFKAPEFFVGSEGA